MTASPAPSNRPIARALEEAALAGGPPPARVYLDRELQEAERELKSAQSYLDDVTRDRDEVEDRVLGIRAALADLDRRDELLTARATAADVGEALNRQGPMLCGDPVPHEAHTKVGDGRPCDGVEPEPGSLAYAQRQAEVAGDLARETEEETR